MPETRQRKTCGFGDSVYLSGLVLCDLVLGVLSAVLTLAVGASCLWDVDLLRSQSASTLPLVVQS